MKPRFDILLNDTKQLVLIFACILGWVISIIGASMMQVTPPLTWFSLLYNLLVVMFVTTTIVYQTIRSYYVAVIAYLAIAFVLCILTIQELSLAKDFLLVNYLACIGLSVLGLALLAGLVIYGKTVEPQTENEPSTENTTYSPTTAYKPATATSYENPNLASTNSQPLTSGLYQTQTSSQFAPLNTSLGMPFSTTMMGGTILPLDYRVKAKALFTYTTEDPSELAFVKDEILDIAEDSGKWWQARNQRGDVGIVPSNYLQVV